MLDLSTGKVDIQWFLDKTSLQKKDIARLLQVTTMTLWNWEHGKGKKLCELSKNSIRKLEQRVLHGNLKKKNKE